MKIIWKQIIALCLVSGLVNQAMLFGNAHLSPCGVNECSMNMEQVMTADCASVRQKTDTVNNTSLFIWLKRFLRRLIEPSFETEEIEAIRERIQNEPRNIRHLIKKFREMLKVDFSKKLVRYTLIVALATAFIDQVTKLAIVLTCPKISGEKEYYEYMRSLLPLKYTINWKHGDVQNAIIVVVGFIFSFIILSIISKMKKIHVVTAILGGLFIGGALSNTTERFLRGGIVDWIPCCITNIPNLADFVFGLAYYGMIRHNIKTIARWSQRFSLSGQIRKNVLRKRKIAPFMLINTKFNEYFTKILIWVVVLSSLGFAFEFLSIIIISMYESISLCMQIMQARTKMSSAPVVDVDPVEPADLPHSAGVSHLATSN